MRSLVVNEDDRISWEEIYQLPLFGNAFKAHLEEYKKLEFKANFIINDLRNNVAAHKIDMLELFQKHSVNGTKGLTFKEYQIHTN